MKICGIYTITNLKNNKIYIGQSIDIFYRWIEHRCRLRNNYNENERLQNAWNKYGENNFSFQILEECEERFLYSQEHYWCNILNSHHRDFGYNLRVTHPENKTGGRQKGFKMSDETALKIFTKERATKISNSKRGKPRSEETKRKLSEYWKKKYEEGTAINPMQGKHHSNKSRELISNIKKGSKYKKVFNK